MILPRALRMELLSTAHSIARVVARGTSEDNDKENYEEQPKANYAPIENLDRHKEDSRGNSTILMFSLIGAAAAVLILCLVIYLVIRFKYKRRSTWCDDNSALNEDNISSTSSPTRDNSTEGRSRSKNPHTVKETLVHSSVKGK